MSSGQQLWYPNMPTVNEVQEQDMQYTPVTAADAAHLLSIPDQGVPPAPPPTPPMHNPHMHNPPAHADYQHDPYVHQYPYVQQPYAQPHNTHQHNPAVHPSSFATNFGQMNQPSQPPPNTVSFSAMHTTYEEQPHGYFVEEEPALTNLPPPPGLPHPGPQCPSRQTRHWDFGRTFHLTRQSNIHLHLRRLERKTQRSEQCQMRRRHRPRADSGLRPQ